jgi:flagellar capping protein FliD
MKVKKVKRFIKSYNKLHSKIKSKFDEKLVFFMENPFEERLNNH